MRILLALVCIEFIALACLCVVDAPGWAYLAAFYVFVLVSALYAYASGGDGGWPKR